MDRAVTGAEAAPHAVTLDVGGSHVTAALVQLAERRVMTEARRDLAHGAALEVVLDGWAQAALEVAAGRHDRPSHLGVAVPGPFDLTGGRSQMEHKFPALLGVPLRPLLADRLRGSVLEGAPMLFGNDADLFALGEWWAGAGRGAERMIGLTLGTGLGSGFVAAGEAVTDMQAVPGGPQVPPGGELWSTSFRGGLAETWACGAALTRAWKVQTGQVSSAHELARLAAGGDGRAQDVFVCFGHDLGELLRPWAEGFGAERVVLGGNVSRAFGLFAPAVQAELSGCEVRVSERFEEAGLLGAAAMRPPLGETAAR